jgi:hypothetical protein
MANFQLQITRNWTGAPSTVNVSKSDSWIIVPESVAFADENALTVILQGSCSANTGSARSGSITISDPTGQATSVVVPVQQAAGGSNPPEPTVYWNVAKSGTATKNNCPSGQSGSSETYTVAANTHSSTVSQAAADALAQADVDANKQSYANTHGTCSLDPVTEYAVTLIPNALPLDKNGNIKNGETPTYHSVAKSGTFTRNNCGTGYSGTPVTYTVAAGAYSSTVSQAAADALAQNDVNANGQAYANQNGTCTLDPVTGHTATFVPNALYLDNNGNIKN